MTTRISILHVPTGQPRAEGVRVDLVKSGQVVKQIATLEAGDAVEVEVEPGFYLAAAEMPGAFPTNADAVATHSDLPAQAPITPPNVPEPPAPKPEPAPPASPPPPPPAPPAPPPPAPAPAAEPPAADPPAPDADAKPSS